MNTRKSSLHALMCAALSSSAFYTLTEARDKPVVATVTRSLDEIITDYFVDTGDFVLGSEVKFELQGKNDIVVSIAEPVMEDVFGISGSNTFDTKALPMTHIGAWYQATLTRDSLDDIVVEIVRAKTSLPLKKTVHVMMAGVLWDETVTNLVTASMASAKTVEQMSQKPLGGHRPSGTPEERHPAAA